MASVPTTRSVGGTPHFFSPTKVRQFRRKFLDLDRAGKGRVPTADFKHIFADVFGREPLKDEIPSSLDDPNAGSVSFDAALRAMNDTARAWQEEEPGVDKTAQEAAAADAAAAASLSVTTSGDASSGAAAAEDVARDIRNSYTHLATEAKEDTEGVPVEKMLKLLQATGLDLTDEDVLRMCQEVGAKPNDDGTLPYHAFVKLMLA